MTDTIAPASESAASAFRDPAALSRITIVSLAVHLGSTLLMLALTIGLMGQLAGLPGDAVPTPESPYAGADATFYTLAAVLQLAVFIINGIVVLVWIYRMSRNAHALARGLEGAPGWAVGWYFIPIGNFWKPFEAMSQVWRASTGGNAWPSEPSPPLLGVWWSLWLINRLVGGIGGRILVRATTVSLLQIGGALSLISLFAGVALDVVFILMVLHLTRLQQEARQGLVFE